MDNATKVKQEIDLLEYISQYTEIKKSGSNYMAKCPFHDDNTPSMSIDNKKGVFNCFTCGGGDIFTFVQMMEGLDFKEALNKLSNDYDIRLDKHIRKNRNRGLKQLVKDLCNQDDEIEFIEDEVEKYKRNQHKLFLNSYDRKTLEEFNIGFCFDPCDDLNNRVTIPWYDENRNLIGIVGRDVTDNSKAKYKAKKGTRKNSTFYNLHRAKHYEEIIIVEDERSVLRLYEFGINNVVALGGLSIKNRRFLLRKHTTKLQICLDNDKEADEKFKKIKGYLNPFYELEKVELTGVKDVDEIKEKEKWIKMYQNRFLIN